jgi:hypothetical protein
MLDTANMPTKKEALICIYYLAEAGLKLNQMPNLQKGSFYESFSIHFIAILKSYFQWDPELLQVALGFCEIAI